MKYNRSTRRIRIGKGLGETTFGELVERLQQGIPEIVISDKPMNHKEGILNCVYAANNVEDALDRILSYRDQVFELYNRVESDKKQHELRKSPE